MNEQKISLPYKMVLATFRFIFRFFTKVDAKGLEQTPMEGPLLIAANHISIFEGPIIFAMIPRQPVSTIAKAEYRDWIVSRLFFKPFAPVYVTRGEPDRNSLKEILKRLKNNQALGIAPEGTRSKNNTLIQGKEGTAYLALKSGAWILPLAVWGQEKILHDWTRLRRPTIYIRAAKPFKLENNPNKTLRENLAANTERIMHAIARQLPPEYRGYYAEAVQDEPEW